MDKSSLYQQLKELDAHLASRRDEKGRSILRAATDMLQSRTLSDVSENELMEYLGHIEQMEGSLSPGEWVSTNAVRTDVGIVTRGMIEKEINRRAIET